MRRQISRARRWDPWLLVVITVLMAYGWLHESWTAFHAVSSVLCLAFWTWSTGFQLRLVGRRNEALNDQNQDLNEQAALLRERRTTLDLREADLRRREATVSRLEVARSVNASILAMEDLRNAVIDAVIEQVPDPAESEKPEPPSVYDRLLEDDEYPNQG